MDFEFTPEQQEWREEVRRFFSSVITAELRQRVEEDGSEFDEGVYQALVREGYTGIAIPKEYGGQGRSHTELAIFNEEAALAGVPHGITSLFGGSAHFAAFALLRLGTAGQKRHYLPRIISGEFRFNQGFTEPGCGSDLAAVQTRAVLDGDEFVVTGEKIFNSGHLATHLIAVVRTDREAPKHKGISILLADLGLPGVQVSPLITLRGWRRNSVAFDNARMPRGCLLGELNRGWYQLMSVMDLERSGVSLPAEMSAAFEELLCYVRGARRDGRALTSLPEVRRALADIHRMVRIGRLLSYQVLSLQEAGANATLMASFQKLYNSEAMERIVNLAIDIVGPTAILEWANASDAAKRWAAMGGLLNRMYKDSRIMQIAGGTSEIQRNIIAQRGLGLPRD